MSAESPSPSLDVRALRAAEFPSLEGSAYLNAASFTPLPERSRRAIDEFNRLRQRPADLADERLVAELVRAREAAARLIGATPTEVALGWNTSFGINLAALALPAEPGSAVVVSDREFPANVYPWMAVARERLDIIPTDPLGRPDEDRLFERLDRGDVGIFAISSVQFSTGFRASLERFGRFCRKRGIYFVVDGIQSLGQIPIDVREAGVDVLATGGQKWLCAPFGTGFVYVREELLERMEPAMVGWTGMTASSNLASLTDYRWDLRRDARRFEVSTLPFHDFAGFTRSLELLLEVGVERIARHTTSLLDMVVEWLRDHGEVEIVSALEPGHRSAILAFRTPAVDAVAGRLAEAGITCGLREGAIRLAPHLYNQAEEMARVLEVLESSRAVGWA
jgi:cysteine desulfurase / selenocysteine lyase